VFLIRDLSAKKGSLNGQKRALLRVQIVLVHDNCGPWRAHLDANELFGGDRSREEVQLEAVGGSLY
jgi:hypothetical protein